MARLVVTPFYPLAEVTPLIRYDTGDIVYLDPERPVSCARCFRLLGRAPDVLTLLSAAACISRLCIADMLDDFHSVRRKEELPAAKHLGVRADVGLPLFSC